MSIKIAYYGRLLFMILTTVVYSTDTLTDIILVVSYFRSGHTAWAVSTLVLTVLPYLFINCISLRWKFVDSEQTKSSKLFHYLGLGIFHRYLEMIQLFLNTPASDYIRMNYLCHLQSDVCILRLFESFLESAPQLVLQLYVMAELDDWNPWNALSVGTSLLSLAWGVTSYARAQRAARADKAEMSFFATLFQSLWRVGTLGARIISLVLATRILQEWILVILMCHLCCMTVWIRLEKTDFCATQWEEFVYNCIVGCIYCFDFFNVTEGQSRYKMAVFYCVISIENIVFLTIYEVFGNVSDRLYLVAPVLVTVGTVFGLTSLVVYYCFFHPSGKIRPTKPQTGMTSLESILSSKGRLEVPQALTPTVRTLKNHRSSKSLRSSPGQENDLEASVDLSLELPQPEQEAVVSVAVTEPTSTETIEENQQQSSEPLHISKVIEDNISEILSTHDYENIAAINICRNLWGVRHWNTYFDIQTRNHDYSVARDTDYLDSTLTSYGTSKDYMELNVSSRPGIFASQCESLPDLFNTSVIQSEYCEFGTLTDLWRSSTMDNIFLAEDSAKVIAFSEESGSESGSYIRGCLSPRNQDYENVWDRPTPKRGQLHDFYARLPTALETILEENEESLISNQSIIKRCTEMRRSRASQAMIKRLASEKLVFERHSPPKRPESAQSNHSTNSSSSLVATVEEIVHSDVCDLYHAEVTVPIPTANSSPEELKSKAKEVLQLMHRSPVSSVFKLSSKVSPTSRTILPPLPTISDVFSRSLSVSPVIHTTANVVNKNTDKLPSDATSVSIRVSNMPKNISVPMLASLPDYSPKPVQPVTSKMRPITTISPTSSVPHSVASPINPVPSFSDQHQQNVLKTKPASKVPLTYEEVSFLSKLAVEQENIEPSFSSTPTKSGRVRRQFSVIRDMFESPISSPTKSASPSHGNVQGVKKVYFSRDPDSHFKR